VGGSNPSLLKKSACLLFAGVAISVIATDPSAVISMITDLTGGINMETIQTFKAVMFATTKAAAIFTSSVMAGLAANGVTPHLH
jgi:hypothetical protein